MNKKIQNAKISSTFLGMDDHGIFTCWLMLEGDGWGCGFGGYRLDQYDENLKQSVGTAYGHQFIILILQALEVDSWEKLTGKYVRAETNGLGEGISRVGHLLKEKWFDPKSVMLEVV